MDKKICISCACVLLIVVIIIGCLLISSKNRNTSNETLNQIEQNEKFVFVATIVEVEETRLVVEIKEEDSTSWLTGTVIVLLGDDNKQVFNVKDEVKVTYSGQVMMSFPPQIFAMSIEKINTKSK